MWSVARIWNLVIPLHLCIMYLGKDMLYLSILMYGVSWDVTPCGFCKNRRFGGI
jgi:hypothetical protein